MGKANVRSLEFGTPTKIFSFADKRRIYSKTKSSLRSGLLHPRLSTTASKPIVLGQFHDG